MKFAKGEKRVLTAPLVVRTSISVGTIPVGEVIEIQQVSVWNREVLIENNWFHESRITECSEPIKEA
jgi:hypothetical protein